MTDSATVTREDAGKEVPVRRLAIASTIGTIIEAYDFVLYGTVAALVFDKLFFPDAEPVIATLASFATFGVGFLARPVGGAIFGHYGDKVGRKKMLVLALLIMGVATVLIGALPGYNSIGIAAPILLVVLRLIQGAALGGEWGGAVLMVTEYAPKGKRGFYGSWPQIGFAGGLALSTSIIWIMSSSLSDAAFESWGWRVPVLRQCAARRGRPVDPAQDRGDARVHRAAAEAGAREGAGGRGRQASPEAAAARDRHALLGEHHLLHADHVHARLRRGRPRHLPQHAARRDHHLRARLVPRHPGLGRADRSRRSPPRVPVGRDRVDLHGRRVLPAAADRLGRDHHPRVRRDHEHRARRPVRDGGVVLLRDVPDAHPLQRHLDQRPARRRDRRRVRPADRDRAARRQRHLARVGLLHRHVLDLRDRRVPVAGDVRGGLHRPARQRRPSARAVRRKPAREHVQA